MLRQGSTSCSSSSPMQDASVALFARGCLSGLIGPRPPPPPPNAEVLHTLLSADYMYLWCRSSESSESREVCESLLSFSRPAGAGSCSTEAASSTAKVPGSRQSGGGQGGKKGQSLLSLLSALCHTRLGSARSETAPGRRRPAVRGRPRHRCPPKKGGPSRG